MNNYQYPGCPFPNCSEQVLLLFVAHLANEGLVHSEVYLSALCNLHITTGHHRTFASQLTSRVVLQGIKQTQACQSLPRVHLPITIQLVRRIRAVLLQEPHNYDNILLWAACCTVHAFFGFLRCSEFTVPSIQDYDPSAHLS